MAPSNIVLIFFASVGFSAIKALNDNIPIGALEFLVLALSLLARAMLNKRLKIPRLPTLFFSGYLIALLSSTLLYTTEYRHFELSTLLSLFVVLKIFMIGLIAVNSPAVKFNAQPYRKATSADAFEYMLVFLLGINILACVLQFFYPSIHASVFTSAHNDTHIKGTELRRLSGIFYHPSVLAYLAIGGFLHWLGRAGGRFGGYRHLIGLISCVLLVMSGQRAEFAFALASLMAFVIYRHWLGRSMLKQLGAANLKIMMLGFTLAFCFFVYLLALSPMSIYDQSTIVRASLILGSAQLALEHFPLGSGLTTYGSFGSEESIAYDITGIASTWWFSAGKSYLTDSGWANTLGESGVLGMLLFLSFVISLFHYIEKRPTFVQSTVVAFLLFSAVFNPIFTGPIFPVVMLTIIYIERPRSHKGA
jgi:hypothetical protein